MNKTTDGGMVPLIVRKFKFPFKEMTTRDYFGGNKLLSAWGAALSGSFPPGEKEFIESVRNYQDKVSSDKLKANIKDFIHQEGQHSYQHRLANEQITALGWDAKHIEERLGKVIKRRIAGNIASSDKWRLAITTCAEHFTAIMCAHLLEHPEVLDSLDPKAKDLLLWHSVEEVEHKSVAFDTFMDVENDAAFLRRAMVLTTIVFLWGQVADTIILMWRARKLPNFRDLIGYSKFMFGKTGMARKLAKPYFDFYRKDFHPWDHANTHLIERWESEFYRKDMEKNPA